MLDRTLYNIVTFMVGGAALVSALTSIAVPHQVFLGGNPFAEKNDAIQDTASRVSIGFTLLAIVAQVIAEILSDSVLPPRLHSTRTYVMAALVTFVIVAALGWLMFHAVHRVARRTWEPAVLRLHAAGFRRSATTVATDGWEPNPPGVRTDHPTENQKRERDERLRDAERYIRQIETLLEIEHEGDLTQRVSRLQPYFAPLLSASGEDRARKPPVTPAPADK